MQTATTVAPERSGVWPWRELVALLKQAKERNACRLADAENHRAGMRPARGARGADCQGSLNATGRHARSEHKENLQSDQQQSKSKARQISACDRSALVWPRISAYAYQCQIGGGMISQDYQQWQAGRWVQQRDDRARADSTVWAFLATMIVIILGSSKGERSAATADTRGDSQAERSAAAISSGSTKRLRSAFAATTTMISGMISGGSAQDRDHAAIALRNHISQGHEDTTVSLCCEMLSCAFSHIENDSHYQERMRLCAYNNIGICA